MTGLTYHKAQIADIEGIQVVAAESWRATYAGIFTPQFIDDFLADAYSTVHLTSSIQDEQSIFLVAKAGARVVGYGHAGQHQGDAVLYRLYLLPAHWRQGAGGGLLDQVEAWLRARGVAGYACHVHSQNEIGRAFYQKHGFVHVADKDQDGEWYLWKSLT